MSAAMNASSIAVIGAGFSGTMGAVQLRRALPDSEVHLFEAGPRFGEGPAYAATDPGYLLNVRSGNMSAFPDDPGHFERWLAAAEPVAGAPAFAQRAAYGRYLHGLLAEDMAHAPGRLHLHQDQVLRLTRGAAGWQVRCASGLAVDADTVVIATGNLPSATPDDGVTFHNPWAPQTLAGLRPDEPVLIVGTGLTMVDLAQGLRGAGFAGPVLALSRRGLVPHAHAAPMPPWPCPEALLQPGLPLSALLRTLRRTVAAAAAQGVDWRAVIDGLRPITTRLWTSWPPAQRARFLRHLRPYWDTHRHRTAPAVAARFEALRAEGQLRLRAGRLLGIERHEGQWGPVAEVSIQWRGTTAADQVTVQRVILATGAGTALADDPLLADLIATGTARTDPNGLGLAVNDALQILDGEDRPVPGLWALGPAVRGMFWECTAVPDIRQQAQRLAAAIAQAGA